MITSLFNDTGLPLGANSSNMTYLYGIGDFFQILFEDTAVPNLLLEADSQVAADVYSKFLQLTSTLSLESIQTTLNTSMQLALVNSTNRVTSSEFEEYVLPISLQSSRYIANRPLLPTALLEEYADFQIFQDADGTSKVRLARPIEEYPFPSRLLADGSTKQYALWFVDANLDERLLSKYFASLIEIDPQNSSEDFANFLYGLYYVYVKGPTLADIRRGLNLTLGIPLARVEEQVIDIRTYLETDQFLVITDQFQYLIPYGLPPSVSVGDTLEIGKELAEWIEIKDYLHDGEWWLNLHIPKAILPEIPTGEHDRYADKGGWIDYIMRQYLRKHTFLVNVKVTNFSNTEHFAQISKIVHRARPSYTQPIYIWTVVASDEDTQLHLEETFSVGVTSIQDEITAPPVQEMRRDTPGNSLRRGKSFFYRYQVPSLTTTLCGTDPYYTSSAHEFEGEVITGYTNPMAQFRSNSREEIAKYTPVMNRFSDTWRGLRNKVGFRRDLNIVNPETGLSWFSTPGAGSVNSSAFNSAHVGGQPGEGSSALAEYLNDPMSGVYTRHFGLNQIYPRNIRDRRVVPLYVTKLSDLEEKFALIKRKPPQNWDWELFLEFSDLRGDVVNGKALNSVAINGQSGISLDRIYNAFFHRDVQYDWLPSVLPSYEAAKFLPARPELRLRDALLFVQIQCGIFGVYWITENNSLEVDPYHFTASSDPLQVTWNMPRSRQFSDLGVPVYLTRTRLGYNISNSGVNDAPLNEVPVNGALEEESLSGYSDLYNDNVDIYRIGSVYTQAVRNI